LSLTQRLGKRGRLSKISKNPRFFYGYEPHEKPEEEGPQEEGIETPFPTWPLPLEKADNNRRTFSPLQSGHLTSSSFEFQTMVSNTLEQSKQRYSYIGITVHLEFPHGIYL
jgi:hypothetical protein